ncbi:uncharacterized protein LOC131657901 [Vicia villosa]|uniref:uncharacterized protein LOC131657901 n=1 Tax=Vicia villosa TaxID=3911 RepID=UPI00273A910B|nr:uncharacterized protein LOC131657901 [Vicia villosa]
MEHISCSMAGSFWRTGGVDFSFIPSLGASREILTLWNTNTVKAIFNFGGRGFLGMKILWRGSYFYVVNVYSPISREEKRTLWDKILSLKSRFSDGEWLLGGDFNAVRNRRERKGVSLPNPRKEWSDFEEFIRKSGLEDVPCKGKKYTWFGGDGRSRSRIDRFLVADNIVSGWGVIGQLVEDRDVSDHCPKEWLSLKVEGRGDFILKEKLRMLKDKLRWWNINVFGKYDFAVEENSRLKWLNDGDANNKYFHGVMKARRTRNFIGSIVTGGGIINSVTEIKEEVKNHFEKKFVDDGRMRPMLDGISFDTLEEEDKLFLEKPFEDAEIKEAIWDCDGLKSPGPD